MPQTLHSCKLALDPQLHDDFFTIFVIIIIVIVIVIIIIIVRYHDKCICVVHTSLPKHRHNLKSYTFVFLRPSQMQLHLITRVMSQELAQPPLNTTLTASKSPDCHKIIISTISFYDLTFLMEVIERVPWQIFLSKGKSF